MTACLEIFVGTPVSEVVARGQLSYFIYPFPNDGLTVRVEVSSGGVWCYASDIDHNPGQLSYIWRLFISEYDDSFIDPTTLGRVSGEFLYIGIEGVDSSNNFTLDSTTGDTSITGMWQLA